MKFKNYMNVISLFSGAGGLDLGFKKAGFKIISSADIMKEAVETHNFNFKLKSSPIDLTNPIDYLNFINSSKKNKIQFLIGGFPCQGYSLAGKRNLKDKRNKLYIKIVDVLVDLKINYFLLENVPGILSMNNGEEINKIKRYFNKNNFYFKFIVLDSSNFSVPQKRKRVIFIGQKGLENIKEIDIIINKLKNIKNKEISVKESILDLENKNENIENNHIFTKHTKEIKNRMKNLLEGESLYKNYSDGWKRIFYNKPSPTVKENHGGVHIHPVKNRVLTPRELARLQTFPDNFIFKGSKKAQLIQIGNAVPVKFAEIIARNIYIWMNTKKQLNDLKIK